MTAGLLALFLGAFGVYHFYIGDTKQGITRIIITLLALIPFITPAIVLINLVWNLIIGIQVLTSSTGSKWHKTYIYKYLKTVSHFSHI
ncbi:NINE protein [Streptococcus suis]|uniref:NINE protein n=1 Tax=Streptococcus suis TaxID=1307 RepID=A0A822VXS4_STRSU|nr:NINE protein [Streptococcus suis]MDE1696430.1 NINE protein [Streptococcus suis]MDW8645254.1 NINE protein [Streptococcus suis]MEE3813805.1 NINE protein [Streptococcus suis]CYX46029.1 Uncharacterised protein [Streptococcus suis]